jgi:phenylpyruvate tautomerase PptA (4-oxalocrotonate tautomerase family)
MPMVDAYIPEGALSASAERDLLAKITDRLLAHEGVDPGNERARPLAWVFVHPQVYVAGAPPKSPRHRFICQVPEGQYDAERRAAVTAAMTQAVAEAEGGAWPHIPARGQ